MHISPIHTADHAALLRLATDTGLFTPDEAAALLGDVLARHAAHTLPPGHQAVCCRTEAAGDPLGWCYFAPDDHAAGVWQLWWIGVAPRSHGQGAGRLLLDHVEAAVTGAGARLLVIETSDADALARARRFYAARGYAECGRIPHFYAEGEAKVMFARPLAAAARS